MKRKTIITVVSSVLNLVLLATLAYSTKVHSRTDGSSLLSFHYVQRLPDVAVLQNASKGNIIAGVVK
jgi:hypothetical protein